MSMKLSIITICYNEKDVENTCLSIAQQTWQDFEWIVIDGGSDSWCTDILEKYREHMAYYVSEKDAGRYDAMNKGISHANGEYLLFMNAGDYFVSAKTLEKVSNYFSNDADIFYGDAVFKMPKGNYKYELLPDEIDISFFIKNCLTHQASYIKASLFHKFGGYSIDYKIVSDWKKWLEFMQAGCTFEHLAFLCAIFDCNGISATNRTLSLAERAQILPEYFTKKSIECATSGHTLQNSNPYIYAVDAKPLAISNDKNAPQNPNVSAIMRVFNTAGYLTNCLDSLLSQKHGNMEIICVNDGSYDNSLAILEEYAKKDERIRIYSFEENVGVATCRNYALSKAHGEYIGFIDAGDWVSSDFYETLYKEAKEGSYDIAKGQSCVAYNKKNYKISKRNSEIAKYLEQDTFLGLAFQSELYTALYRKSFLQNIHAEFPSLYNGEDKVFLLNILLQHPRISLVDGAFYYSREIPDYARPSDSKLNINYMFEHFEMLCDLLNKRPLSQAEYMNYYFHAIFVEMLRYYENTVFFELTSAECALYLQRICGIMKMCQYLELLLELCPYSMLKKSLEKELITEAEIAQFQKEIFIKSSSFVFSYYKYFLCYKLSHGRKRIYYKRKYLICKKIKKLST